MSVGYPDLDADHKRLIAILNEIFAAGFAGVGDRQVSAILDRLDAYAAEHFTREERILAERQFEGLEEHVAAHAKLLKQLRDFRARLGPDARLGAEVLGFLRHWLLDHILGEDKEYAGLFR